MHSYFDHRSNTWDLYTSSLTEAYPYIFRTSATLASTTSIKNSRHAVQISVESKNWVQLRIFQATTQIKVKL